MSTEQPKLDLNIVGLVIFDLDGVVTDTASVHAAAWKRTFDDYLNTSDATFEPFDIHKDYACYVDGKPRLDGVQDFLAARGADLPEGTPEDTPERETVYGLGERKDKFFRKQVTEQGVDVYDTTVALIHKLRVAGVKVALVSSSKNTQLVLETTGLTDLFVVVIDGRLAEQLRLPGKPAPDTFLEAARRLKVSPERSAIVEDAIAGIKAGVAGKFAVKIGVARKGDRAALYQAGADVVVEDLAELTFVL